MTAKVKIEIEFPECGDYCEHCTLLPPFTPRVQGSLYCLNCDDSNGETTVPDPEHPDDEYLRVELPEDLVAKAWKIYHDLYEKPLEVVLKVLRNVKAPVSDLGDVIPDDHGYEDRE